MDDCARREICADCTALVNAFAYHLDCGEYMNLVTLFADNAMWERDGVRLHGGDEILAALEKRPRDQFARHCITGVHFRDVGESQAKAASYILTVFSTDPPVKPGLHVFRPGNLALVEVKDVFRRTPRGWRIAHRLSNFGFMPESVLAR